MPTVFPLEPADESFSEVYAFSTDVQGPADDGSEQRVQRRQRWFGRFEFNLWAEGREAGYLQALLYQGHADQWAVPWWPYVLRPSADIADGDVTINLVSAANLPRPFDEPVILWRDPYTFQLRTLTDVNDVGIHQSIDVDPPVAGAWPAASTLVIPARYGRLPLDVRQDWDSGALATGRVAFDLEPHFEAAPIDTSIADLTTLDVEPDGSQPRQDRLTRRVLEAASGMGVVARSVRDPVPALTRDFRWMCFSKAAVHELRDWLTARRGRAVPFQMASWQRDLLLAAPASTGDSSVLVQAIGYAARLFPASNARRWLRFRAPDGTAFEKFVSTATDNEDGTESLGLSGALPHDVDATWSVSFRRYCRLDSDEVTIDWSGSEYAEARLPIRELPNEVTGD